MEHEKRRQKRKKGKTRGEDRRVSPFLGKGRGREKKRVVHQDAEKEGENRRSCLPRERNRKTEQIKGRRNEAG